MKNKFWGNVHPAVAAVWAAVLAAGHIFPTIPILGTGGSFSLTSALSPLSGIFFGPVAGALCSAVGGCIGSLIAPHTAWAGVGTFIIGTTTAFTSGCIAWGKWPPVAVDGRGSLVINGAIIVYITGTILWFTQEIGREVFMMPVVLYGLGFVVMIIGIIFARRLLSGSSRILKFPAIWICAFGGLIGGATVGNFLTLVLFRLPENVWSALIIAAPIERAIFAAGAMLIGSPLLAGLNKIGVPAGPQAHEGEETADER